MQFEWQGYYLDGRTAGRRRVAIRLMQSGLEIATEDGAIHRWPYEEIRQTQGAYAGQQIRLERGGEIAEAVLISDPAFLADLHRLLPGPAAQFHNPAGRERRIKLTLLALFGIVGVAAALYLWIIPAAVASLVPYVPVSWEEHLGKQVIEALAPPSIRCADPLRGQILDGIVARMTAPVPSSPYKFRVIVVDDPTVNALAAPGGYIVIFRGLLDLTRNAEELAGVLAHEAQHVLQRHTTRALLQHASTGLVVAAVTGDAGGALTYGLEVARTLDLLRYSRRHEEEADLEGLRMLLAAGIDPMGMVVFFELIKKQEGELPAIFKYLSTHPGTEDRIDRLKSIAGESKRKPAKLLPDYNWRDIKRICPARRQSGASA